MNIKKCHFFNKRLLKRIIHNYVVCPLILYFISSYQYIMCDINICITCQHSGPCCLMIIKMKDTGSIDPTRAGENKLIKNFISCARSNRHSAVSLPTQKLMFSWPLILMLLAGVATELYRARPLHWSTETK